MVRQGRRIRLSRLLGLLLGGLLVGSGLGGLRVIDRLHLIGEVLDGLAPPVSVRLGVGLHGLGLVERRLQCIAHGVVRHLAVVAREQRVPVSDCLVQVRLDRPGLVIGDLLRGRFDAVVGSISFVGN